MEHLEQVRTAWLSVLQAEDLPVEPVHLSHDGSERLLEDDVRELSECIEEAVADVGPNVAAVMGHRTLNDWDSVLVERVITTSMDEEQVEAHFRRAERALQATLTAVIAPH